uniref:DUF7835 family putative zinc beta-ribbon protein n=1 Tax=Halegenticoccus tardaugens TaxID=2071624 RepID=UPI0013E97841|nr:hypothetical protein [Halegenticoccus tardaugens]
MSYCSRCDRETIHRIELAVKERIERDEVTAENAKHGRRPARIVVCSICETESHDSWA